jgi:hypothetical protein
VDGDWSGVVGDGGGDLFGGKDQPARGVQDQVDRDGGGAHLDGADEGFGVVDVDVAAEGDAKEREVLAAVDEGDRA